MLIKTQTMLSEMQDAQANHRPVFSLVAVSADKRQWQRKQTILNKADKLKPGKKRDKLLAEAASIISGGTLLLHSKCVLMSARGKHSKAKLNTEVKAKATQRHYDNRTRNIQLLPSDNILKVHFDTITHFNNQRVIH